MSGTGDGTSRDDSLEVDGRKTRPSRTETLLERVRTRILEDIIQARLQPGTMVQLSALAKEYQVSRTPVREALAILERQGLISAIPYKGYLVRQIEPRDVRDIFFMRRLLESAAVELAVPRLTSDLLDALREPTPPRTDVMTLEYDNYAHNFHRTIVEAAGSPRLLSAFEGVYNDVRRLQYAGIGNPRPDLIHQEHADIVEAIQAKDSEKARLLMERHIDMVRVRALDQWMTGN